MTHAVPESTVSPPRRWLLIWSVLGPLVGVCLGGVVTYTTVERQILASVEAEQRELRASTYLTLIDAADNYANRTDDLLEGVRFRGSVTSDLMNELRPLTAMSDWLNARNAFQDALNRAFIYGSDGGWKAALALAGTLPYAQGDNVVFQTVDSAFNDRYRDVLAIICQEATISPREECSTSR